MVLSSMIVDDLDLVRPLVAPPKYDPPLVVYADRVLAREVSSQGFQTVPWRRTHQHQIEAGTRQQWPDRAQHRQRELIKGALLRRHNDTDGATTAGTQPSSYMVGAITRTLSLTLDALARRGSHVRVSSKGARDGRDRQP